ncbi:GntR family transcriptional regulator [Lutispora saccharofermentans]|uniref:GntR family transcriptional regulator n=1 Tax=Lutispora saccharofermentans TaxID=3024236 RepID=A0ABT1NCG5_9FIRM|nr:GntR family transcriptional regulator [Lutispora saccharofermentans]MCQ1528955.1 GntR family transcriptional regulator [Lutispora saccharofermentans]
MIFDNGGDIIINADRPTPLYQQLKDTLRANIINGDLSPHEKVPTERELSEMYNVSRITVRQALADLTNEGFIYKVQGKGTFVSPPKVEQPLFSVTPFEETLKAKGIIPSTQLLEWKSESADFEIATKLAIPISSSVIKLTLLGLGDKEPMAIYNSFFSETLGREMVKSAEFNEKSQRSYTTIDLYKSIPDIKPKMQNQSFEALPANGTISDILKIPYGAPVFFVTSIIYDMDDRPIELKTAAYRGDKYRFNITRMVK